MAQRITSGGTSSPATRVESSAGTRERASAALNSSAPSSIRKIRPVVSAVESRLSFSPCQRMPPSTTASTPVAAAPTAAPSVGLNQPAYMPVTTSTKTRMTGQTSSVGRQRSRHGMRCAGGAAPGTRRA